MLWSCGFHHLQYVFITVLSATQIVVMLADFINIQASDSCDGPWKVAPSPPPSAPPPLSPHFYVLLVSSVSSDQFPVFSSLPSKFAAFFCKQVFASIYCTILTISS